MTVHYQQAVATEKVGGFFRLLLSWRGSIYKHIYGEIAIFLLLFYIINFSQRFLMDEFTTTQFQKFCKYCRGFTDYIPVTFVVGFYVIRVITRRWTQWDNMPWPERLAFEVATYIQGNDVKSRMIRRTVMRYCNLGSILCFRDICIPAKRRFPNVEYLLIGGLMTPKEMDVLSQTSSRLDVNWWIPFHWAYTLAWKTYQEGKLTETGLVRIHDGISDMRARCWTLFSHDWIPIPMVYTQVCTLAVYLYMFACLFARQYIAGDDAIDIYFPLFTVFQLVFYLGWMKVAEVLINPLGMDADDFDMNYVIDRNLRTSYTIVDYACQRLPPLEKDVHWDSEEPQLPYTDKSKDAAAEPFVGSTANMTVSEDSESSSEAGNGLEATDRESLIGRKTSRISKASSESSSHLGPGEKLSNMAAKFRRLLSRQRSTVLEEEDTIGETNGDLLDTEVARWTLSPSPRSSPALTPSRSPARSPALSPRTARSHWAKGPLPSIREEFSREKSSAKSLPARFLSAQVPTTEPTGDLLGFLSETPEPSRTEGLGPPYVGATMQSGSTPVLINIAQGGEEASSSGQERHVHHDSGSATRFTMGDTIC